MVPVSVTVLLFAALKERLGGKSRIQIQLQDNVFDTCTTLLSHLLYSVDELNCIQEFKSQLAIAINEEYKTDEDGSIVLNDGDIIALIPPITGG